MVLSSTLSYLGARERGDCSPYVVPEREFRECRDTLAALFGRETGTGTILRTRANCSLYGVVYLSLRASCTSWLCYCTLIIWIRRKFNFDFPFVIPSTAKDIIIIIISDTDHVIIIGQW